MKPFEFVEISGSEYAVLIKGRIEHYRTNIIPEYESIFAKAKLLKKTFWEDPTKYIERCEWDLKRCQSRLKDEESLLRYVEGLDDRYFYLSDEQMKSYGAY